MNFKSIKNLTSKRSSLPDPLILQTANFLLAYAMSDLFPGVKLFKSSFSEIDFSYDFILNHPIDEGMIVLIEEKMRSALKEEICLEKLDMMRENARDLFLYHKQPFKAEELQSCLSNIVQVFKIGKIYDLPSISLEDLTEVLIFPPVFKLLKIEKKELDSTHEKIEVTKITGTVASDKQKLKIFLKTLDGAKKRDPFELGLSMGLFIQDKLYFKEEIAYLPRGQFIKESLLNLLKCENEKLKIPAVSTPPLSSTRKEKNEEAFLSDKSFFHALLYKSQIRQKMDLPLRFFELYEAFSEKNELKSFYPSNFYLTETTTIFCSKEEGLKELIASLKVMEDVFKKLGLDYHYSLKDKPLKKIQTIESFKETAPLLEKALNELKLQFVIDKEELNPYIKWSNDVESGPAIEVKVTDFIGRQWVVSSLCLEIKAKEICSLFYIDEEGRKQNPLMIKRVIFKSIDLIMALMIEKYAGIFPLWLADVEAKVLPIAKRNQQYGKEVLDKLIKAGFRGSIDLSLVKLGEKIHRAENEKIPYMLIVGDNEEKSGTIKVRSCMQEKEYEQEKDYEKIKLELFLTQLESKKQI